MSNFSPAGSVSLVTRLRPFFLRPVFVFSIVWLGVSFLYSLHLSGLLQYSTSEAYTTALYLWLPFTAAALIYSAHHHFLQLTHPPEREKAPFDLALLDSRLTVWFRVWVCVSAVEIVATGGLPLFWLFTNSSKDYGDFGIPSIHGMVNSLLLSIGICRFALFLITGKRRQLAVPAFVVGWSVLAVTRNMMIVSLLEYSVIFLQIRPVRTATWLKFVALLLIAVLAFGAVGIFAQALPMRFDQWRATTTPTGCHRGSSGPILYITTPINNLIYNMHVVHPSFSPLFPNTAATLFPSVLRVAIYGSHLDDAESGALITSAFNVSTAYIGPYQDCGIAGIALFSVFAALLCQSLWYRKTLQSAVMFAVATQCLVLTLFFNHFLSLPVISQLAWLAYFFHPARRFAGIDPCAANDSCNRADLSKKMLPQKGGCPHMNGTQPILSFKRLRESNCRSPRLSILVRVKNEMSALPEFLRRIAVQHGAAQTELVFLDSGSTDGTLQLICGTNCSVYQIAAEDFSYGSSCNCLMELSHAPICMFLSGHVLLQRPDSLEMICSALKDEALAAAYLRQIPSAVFGSNCYERAYLARRFPAGDSRVPLEGPGAFSNAASALTRRSWERLRFPDIAASEDHAWAVRHLALGGRLLYLPQVIVEHSHRESATDVYRRVRQNVNARELCGNPLKATQMFLGVFGSMLLQGAAPSEAALYASSHARAYL